MMCPARSNEVLEWWDLFDDAKLFKVNCIIAVRWGDKFKCRVRWSTNEFFFTPN